jgi:hypothetical protein
VSFQYLGAWPLAWAFCCLAGKIQKLAGERYTFPPIAKNAMDGAPVWPWWVEENRQRHVQPQVPSAGSGQALRLHLSQSVREVSLRMTRLGWVKREPIAGAIAHLRRTVRAEDGAPGKLALVCWKCLGLAWAFFCLLVRSECGAYWGGAADAASFALTGPEII